MTTPVFDPGPHVAELLRRLRAWSVSSWSHGDRIVVTRSALQQLAAKATSADGRVRPLVPDAGVHALADQVQVLADDAIDAGVDLVEVETLLVELGRQLGFRAR
ncbi:hypothetical protein ABIB25_003692 [Nakamurella sp. UYEF19]|uniref:hypothetical protein n=1 Tax=Nakamurella sp. UYEF19 TaxID=1756392 RepID=UPI00339190FE